MVCQSIYCPSCPISLTISRCPLFYFKAQIITRRTLPTTIANLQSQLFLNLIDYFLRKYFLVLDVHGLIFNHGVFLMRRRSSIQYPKFVFLKTAHSNHLLNHLRNCSRRATPCRLCNLVVKFQLIVELEGKYPVRLLSHS
jgi:hypothetical protein